MGSLPLVSIAERLIAAQAGLVVHEAESLNCETPPALLGGEVTPMAQFYRRSHFPTPALDAVVLAARRARPGAAGR